MRRDCKLILKILRYVRDNADATNPLDPPDCEAYNSEVVAYHVQLCAEAGFIRLSGSGALLDQKAGILALTWDGHELLAKHAE